MSMHTILKSVISYAGRMKMDLNYVYFISDLFIHCYQNLTHALNHFERMQTALKDQQLANVHVVCNLIFCCKYHCSA